MKIHRFFDFRRQGAPFASQFLFVFYKSGRPLLSDLVEAFINGKMSDFFPRGSAKGGPSFSGPAIGESALQISSRLVFFKKVPEEAPFFLFLFNKKSQPSIGGFFVRQKRKSPRGSANSGRKKGGPPREFPILKLSIFRAADLASGLPGFRGRRGFPFGPYLHARIPKMTVVEQLPQNTIRLCL